MNLDLNTQQRIAGMSLRIIIKEKPWDLIVVMVLVTLLLGVALIIQNDFLRWVLGLAVLLFLPGYVIISALFPKNEDLDTIERIALSFGLSIVVIPLIGFILNYTPWGIGLFPILGSLFILVISVSIIAWYRRNQISIEERFYIALSIKLFRRKEFKTIDKILTIILVILVIVAIIESIYFITVPKEGKRFTEFYILDENRTAKNYPSNLTINENGTVILGVICHEVEKTIYTVEIELVNLTGERENKTLGQYNFTLDNNQLNETVFQFNISDIGVYKLQFLLYINEIKEPYRDLHLWINITP